MELDADIEEGKIIDHLQKWFEENKKLPNKIDRIHLTRFYICMHKDVEETKKLLTLNYTMRNNSPDIFIKRDPRDQDTKNTYDYVYIVSLPGLSPDNCRVHCLRFKYPDPKMMHFTEDIKTFLMIIDYRLSVPDIVTDQSSLISTGEMLIMDMEGFSMQHLTRISIRALRIFCKFFLQACSVRLKAMHFINCPTYLNKILAFLKPFLSKELLEMMHFHTNGLDDLYKAVPKEMLPHEYGGNAGTFEEICQEMYKHVVNKSEYLMDPNYWTIDK